MNSIYKTGIRNLKYELGLAMERDARPDHREIPKPTDVETDFIMDPKTFRLALTHACISLNTGYARNKKS